MLQLPPSLARYFVDPAGRFDFRALLATPDEDLVALARRMPANEFDYLYRQLCGLQLTWLERVLIQAAGVDVDRQRVRLLRVLEEAATPVPDVAAPCFASPPAG